MRFGERVGTYGCQAVGVYFNHVIELVEELKQGSSKLAKTPVYCGSLRVEVT